MNFFTVKIEKDEMILGQMSGQKPHDMEKEAEKRI